MKILKLLKFLLVKLLKIINKANIKENLKLRGKTKKHITKQAQNIPFGS